MTGKTLTHVDKNNRPQMVDVSAKNESLRTAKARSLVRVGAEIFNLFKDGDLNTKQGPVFSTAIVAGTMAAKRTSDWIPFCHSIMLEHCQIQIKPIRENLIEITSEVRTSGKTGVEMEALVGASAAALTVYDMCKAISHDIEIVNTCLLTKTGGKSDFCKHVPSV